MIRISRDSNRGRSIETNEGPNLNAGRGEAGDADGHPEHEEVEVVDDEGRPANVLSQDRQLVSEVKTNHGWVCSELRQNYGRVTTELRQQIWRHVGATKSLKIVA